MSEPPENHSEYLTRRKRVDPKLKAQGWIIVDFDPTTSAATLTNHAVRELPTTDGPADYGLFVGGQLLGVIEAKKLTLGPHGALVQAERYSKGAPAGTCSFRGFNAPFLYSTNGEVIWFHDIRTQLAVSRRLADFHTPNALREMLTRDFEKACDWFGLKQNDHLRLRPYQIKANGAVEDAIARHKRQMLVAMATGTGKTFTMVNQVYRLLKSGVASRILFLVDRRALAAQAVRAFASFEPEPNVKFDKTYDVFSNKFQREDFGEEDKFDPTILPRSYLEDPQAKHAFVYVCTIQRMAVNLFGRQAVFSDDGESLDTDAEELRIPIHAFDVIIADECHRGYTTAELSIWRNTLDHFDAIKLGLTATPAAHTKAYFNDVVFRYTYTEAVREGYLVDYDAVKIDSDVRMKGVFLKEGDQVNLVNPEDGSEQLDRLEDERDFETTDVERKVTSPDSNRKILEEVKAHAAEHEQRYGRFPKTLIFAANDAPNISHADELVKLARDIFGRGESFVQKITGRVDRPLQRIREFRNRPDPGIVVSVDLMSTGVDIPDLEYIVFLRSVKSRILFEQILGRGTRLGEKFPDKSHFTVFDCFGGTLLDYFRNSTAITADPPEKPSRPIAEVIESIWDNHDRDYNVRCLVKRLQRINKEMDGAARELFEAHGIPEGDLGKWGAQLPSILHHSFKATMDLLRNKPFQSLLTEYSRRKAHFIVAPEYEDSVSSEYLVRDGQGKQYKPEDYLDMFARFVRENPAKIDAISILLDRPADWGTSALAELRAKLTAAPERFTLDTLQKVHKIHYHKSLVDIISMVKHAATEQAPLLTAEERIAAAFKKLSAGRTFTAEQQAWLERIRAHLVANLSIDPADFDDIPVLSDAGGWGRANKVFDGELSTLIRELNRAVAA